MKRIALALLIALTIAGPAAADGYYGVDARVTEESGNYTYWSWMADFDNNKDVTVKCRAKAVLLDREGFILAQKHVTFTVRAGDTAHLSGRMMLRLAVSREVSEIEVSGTCR